MTPEEIRRLTLFNTVESSPEINQRQLAQELDVSLGLTNTYFQRVLKKGWIRAQQVNHGAGFIFSLQREHWKKAVSASPPCTARSTHFVN